MAGLTNLLTRLLISSRKLTDFNASNRIPAQMVIDVLEKDLPIRKKTIKLEIVSFSNKLKVNFPVYDKSFSFVDPPHLR